ncbi:MAG: hypothetical protein IBX63_04375 [Coriobacteriia bacterium]|nr:hypothetical protein [Coriobacteriia bacterium]
MTEVNTENGQDSPESKRSPLVMLVLLGLLAAGVFAAAFFYFNGIDLVDEPEPEESSDITPVSEDSDDADVVAVPEDAQQLMYWEQVDSQEQIIRLIEGKIDRFTLSGPLVGPDDAKLKVETSEGVSGEVVLRNYEGAWFFTKITREGNVSRGPAGRTADTGIVETIVKEQAASQDVVASFVDGGYATVEVVGITSGLGTVTIDVEFAGGTKPARSGQIVALSKEIRGTTHWFLAQFKEL